MAIYTKKNMNRLGLTEWMIKHKVSTQITNSSIAIARALDSCDRLSADKTDNLMIKQR